MVVQGIGHDAARDLDEICYHGRAVAGACPTAHVVGDMPFMSYQVSPSHGRRERRQDRERRCFESVKLEGGEEVAEHVLGIVRRAFRSWGISGFCLRAVHAMGGFKVQGKTREAADRVLRGARAVEEAGAFAVVLEAIPPDLALEITSALSIPTIGIGAGANCDGQVLVCYDMLGMNLDFKPKFAKRFADVGTQILRATEAYVSEVRERSFPALEHAFKPNGFRNPDADGDAPNAEPHWQTN